MVLILVCLVNPSKNNTFIVQLVNEAFRFCLTIFLNTTTSEEEAKSKRECQALLDVARKLFTHLGDLKDLLQEIMSAARNLVDAERCSLFLLDDTKEYLVAKVFDSVTDTKQVKVPKTSGIAGKIFVSFSVIQRWVGIYLNKITNKINLSFFYVSSKN